MKQQNGVTASVNNRIGRDAIRSLCPNHIISTVLVIKTRGRLWEETEAQQDERTHCNMVSIRDKGKLL